MMLELRQRFRRMTSKPSGALGHPDSAATDQARRKVIARRISKQHQRDEVAGADAARLTHVDPVEREAEMHPLEFGLIRRVFTYMRPHRVMRNWLLLAVAV